MPSNLPKTGIGFAESAPCPVLIRHAAQKGSSPRFAVLVSTTQFEDKGAASVVDRDVDRVSAWTDIGSAEFPPLDGRYAVVESFDLTLGEQIGELIRSYSVAFWRVECHDLPVAHVVPVIQRYEEAIVRYKKLSWRNRIEQRSSGRQTVGPILFEVIKLCCSEWSLGRPAESHRVAEALAGNYADEIGARLTENFPDDGRWPVVTLRDWNYTQRKYQQKEPHTLF